MKIHSAGKIRLSDRTVGVTCLQPRRSSVMGNCRWRGLVDLKVIHSITEGEGVKIAIIDGQVCGRTAYQQCYNLNIANRGDIVFNGIDQNGLPTALLTLLAGNGKNGSPIGLAPKADYLHFPVVDSLGNCYDSEIASAIDDAIGYGVDYILFPHHTKESMPETVAAIDRASKKNIFFYSPDNSSYDTDIELPQWASISRAITVVRHYSKEFNHRQKLIKGANYVYGPGCSVDVCWTCDRVASAYGSAIATTFALGMMVLNRSLFVAHYNETGMKLNQNQLSPIVKITEDGERTSDLNGEGIQFVAGAAIQVAQMIDEHFDREVEKLLPARPRAGCDCQYCLSYNNN